MKNQSLARLVEKLEGSKVLDSTKVDVELLSSKMTRKVFGGIVAPMSYANGSCDCSNGSCRC